MNAMMLSLSGQNMNLRASLGDGDIDLAILLGGGTTGQLQDELNQLAGGGGHRGFASFVSARSRGGGSGGGGSSWTPNRGRLGPGNPRDPLRGVEG